MQQNLSYNCLSMGLEKPKKKQKKGLWSPDEDQRLRDYVLKNGHGCWNSLPISAGLERNGKSCRLRWINYLRPGLKRGKFSIAEEETILRLHQILGNKWSQMALHLPGRSDNEIKNYWHSRLKKRVAKKAETSIIGGLQVWSSYVKSTPKVLFAEWVYNHGLDNNFENHSSSSHEDTLLQNGGGTFGVETDPKCSQVYVDDMLRFDYQLHYSPGDLCINYDVLNYL